MHKKQLLQSVVSKLIADENCDSRVVLQIYSKADFDGFFAYKQDPSH